VAYDDAADTIWTFDSYTGIGNGLGETDSYAEFDAWWRHFNRALVVVYPADREADVMRILGPSADPQIAAAQALDTARQEIAADPSDAWAQFNAGTSAVEIGLYADAARYYDRAFRLGLPFRMLWYQFGPYAAYYNEGRYFDVIALADATEAITAEVEETKVWRGLAYAALGRADDALVEFQAALNFNPNNAFAQTAQAMVLSGEYAAPAPLKVAAQPIP
jgi:tetratricopeptide (TPR) repeat protein